MIITAIHIKVEIIEPILAYIYSYWGFIIGGNLLLISLLVRKNKKAFIIQMVIGIVLIITNIIVWNLVSGFE